jgi:GTPase
VSDKKAVLVGLQLPGVDDEESDSSLQELRRLVETLGFEVVGILTQKRKSPAPGTVIGVGKVKELAKWTGGSGEIPSFGEKDEDEHEEEEDSVAPRVRASKVIFDNELTPNQLKNLETATGAEVLDRTGVIVEIFHRHAKTREARLQVEIARLNYLSPRIRATGGGDRQGGGIGSKGVGETAHELDRRRIRDRVAELQAELEVIASDQENRRSRRRESMRVALVGYTNAGKSSLMRALTGSQVLVADKLFATLDTTVRAMQPEEFPRILISDTVGFIKKLPHDLVASFRSTLDEAGDASLLCYVVDASDPTFRSQLEVTQKVIGEIDAADVPTRLILNKVDCLDIAQVHLLAREFPDAMQISTRLPEDVERVKKMIRDFFEQGMQETEILVPYDDQKGLIGEIRKHAAVIAEKYDEKGVSLKIRTFPEALARIQKKIKD